MEMTNLLNPKAVRFIASATSKKRLFQSIGDVAKTVYGLNTETAISALQERETLGPTGVGHGVAVPHARVDGIDSVLGIFFRLEKSLDYGSVDKAPVDLVFALFAPRDAGVDHLKALAFISRTLRNARVCEKLRANEDPAKIYAILTASEGSKAA